MNIYKEAFNMDITYKETHEFNENCGFEKAGDLCPMFITSLLS